MNIRKCMEKASAILIALAMATSMSIPVMAQAPHPIATMTPAKTVTASGSKSFFKVDPNTQTVIYSDSNTDGTWTAIPSAYIVDSEYNEGNIAYGAFVLNDGTVEWIPLSECNDLGNGTYSYTHATKDGATVSEEVDTATNKDPTMGTDFYINVKNGNDPDDNGYTEDDVIVGSEDARVEYEITVRTKSSYQLNATVPAYVCMYGYRGTGTVITPSSDAYQLKNYSTINMSANATITDIVKLTHMTQLLDTEHSDETIYAIAFNPVQDPMPPAGASNSAEIGNYYIWYSKPEDSVLDNFEDTGWIVNRDVTAEKLNASGECYVICIEGKDGEPAQWIFKVGGVLDEDVLRETVDTVDPNFPLKNDFVHGEWNFGKTPSVGDQQDGGEDEGLALKVTELQATPATWRLVPLDTPIAGIKRGEIAMSIAPETAITDASAVDLAKCSAPVDITERGWYLGKPTLNQEGEVTDPTTLPITTNVRMAGNNVNSAGCTSVVRVVYTLTPTINADDNQANTNPTEQIDSNRESNDNNTNV